MNNQEHINKNIEDTPYIDLNHMTLEYSKLATVEEKKKYMSYLATWYMREKDLLTNATSR